MRNRLMLSNRRPCIVTSFMERVFQRRMAIGWFIVLTAIITTDSGCSVAAQTDNPSTKQTADEKSEATKPPPKNAKPDVKDVDRKRFQPYGYVSHEHEVTISGRALNENGLPVVGARVFVVPVIPMGVAYNSLRVLTEGKTDQDGGYRFDKVKLMVLEFAPQAIPRPSEALFQVFAIADGYGYVWRHAHAFRPEKRPADSKSSAKPADDAKPDPAANAAKNDAAQHVFFADEPIVLDLKFSPEVRLHGTITDDLVNPLKDVVVQVGMVNNSRDQPGAPPNTHSCQYLEDSPRGGDGEFHGLFALPEKLRLAKTDEQGRYEIRGLPRDCRTLTYMDYLPEFDPWGESINIRETPLLKGYFVGYHGELNHTFIPPVTMRVHVQGPAQQPLANVIVRQASDGRIRRAGSFDRTDNQGFATLKLRPGKLRLIVEPSFGQPYLPEEQAVELKDDPRELSIEVTLNAAAAVVFEATDKDTGKPISGVAFLSEPADVRERKPVQSQLSFVDHPRTDVTGKMHAFFEPGERRFFVDLRRSNSAFEPVSPATDAIDLSPDKPTKLQFKFTRRPAVAAEEKESGPIADDLKPLVELLTKQSERFELSRRAKFHLRHSNYLTADMTRAQMKQLLDSFESKTVDECLEALNANFPDFRGLGKFEIVTDGTRRRVEFSYPGQNHTEVNAFNGEETIISMDGGRHLNIYGRDNAMVHFLAPRDFWSGPLHPDVLRKWKPRNDGQEVHQTIRHLDGTWEIETGTKQSMLRQVIDDSTGFERQSDYVTNQNSGQETRQFFPTLLATGVAVPKLSVRVHYRDGMLGRCEVTFIDKVELFDHLPPDAFVVAAPPGTNILDYRGIPRNEMGRGRRAPSGVVSSAVPDIVAHRNRFAPASEPVLKAGDQAPELKARIWLNAEGKADPPALAGKIVVIDFWGISCGPCVAQLPEVNAAAKHFVNSNIVIIGLHDSSGTLEQVTEFAKKRDLVFPIVIDEQDQTTQTFGATFASFGINGIPSSAVIDASGHVAYLGEFKQAIEVANKLALKK